MVSEELFNSTFEELRMRKSYFVLFLIPVFIVQVMKLAQFA
jgi:hypothetical protein